MPINFPPNEAQTQEVRDRVESAKHEMKFNESLVDEVIKSLRRYRPDVLDREELVRETLSKFVSEYINPMIQRIVLEKDLRPGHDNFYQIPPLKTRKKNKSICLIPHHSIFEDYSNFIVRKSYDYVDESVVQFKEVSIRHMLFFEFHLNYDSILSGKTY